MIVIAKSINKETRSTTTHEGVEMLVKALMNGNSKFTEIKVLQDEEILFDTYRIDHDIEHPEYGGWTEEYPPYLGHFKL